MNPIGELLDRFPLLLLDGACASELERRGCDLADPLWSAKTLLEAPELIAAVHRDYLEAGADCIITAGYQATFEGFLARGLSEREADDRLRASVTLAIRARDAFWAEPGNRAGRPRPLVAASVGPYGAFLADGSEYRGRYDRDEKGLDDFHRRRLATFIAAGPDLLACETIPCLTEAKVLARLVEEEGDLSCWVSFSARDGTHISSGEPIRDCAAWLDDCARVAAIGVNCTPPQYIASLIEEIRGATDKPVIVYPNSGEDYAATGKQWQGAPLGPAFAELARGWYQQGARIIGGCCRTTPADIRAIREGTLFKC